MRALIKPGRRSGIDFCDIPKPVPKDNEVLIKVKAAAICGTDFSCWKWNDAGRLFSDKYRARFPFVLGHECSGIVEDCGKDAKGVKVGSKVAIETHIFCGECYQCRHGDAHNCQYLKIYGTSCDGCFSEYAVAPAECVYTLPDPVSFEEGALFEPAGCAMFGVMESGLEPGDVAMVYGCGPIGQIAIQILYARGAKTVIAVDIDDYKCDIAEKLGAVPVNSTKQDIAEVVRKHGAERGGVDVIMEISGASSIYGTMFDYLRPEGRVVLLAHPGTAASIDMIKPHHKGATIKGVFGRRIWSSWAELTKLVTEGRIDLTKVITHSFPLSAGEQAFEQIEKGAGKVLFLPELQ